MTPVIFDMDGTLLDSETLYSAAFVTAGRGMGITDETRLHDAMMACIGLSGDLTAVVLAQHFPEHDAAALNAKWRAAVVPLLEGAIPHKPGAAELIATLSERGHPLAVATSTDTDHAHEHLEKAGLLPHFKVVIGGDQVTRRKPDPEIYRTAAAALNIDIHDAVVFEDSEPGTRAAVAAGAKVVQVPDIIAPSEALRALGHVVAPDLLEGARMVGLI